MTMGRVRQESDWVYVKHGKRKGLHNQNPRIASRTNIEKRLEAFEKLGGAYCVRCGCTDIRVLCIDHVHDDNARHRRTTKSILNSVLKYPDRTKYKVLCMNCNWIKNLARIIRKNPGSAWYEHFSEDERVEFEIAEGDEAGERKTPMEEYAEKLLIFGPHNMP